MTRTGSIFVRNATGLVREVGLLSAILFCLTYTVQLWGPSTVLPYWSGYGNFVGNFWLGLAIGTLTVFLVNSVYAHFSAAMPRSGGDYVFLGRTIHPLLGFAPNWVWAWIASFWNAANLLFFGNIMMLLLGSFYSQETLAPVSTTGGTFALGLICWIIGLATILGMKWFVRINYFAWIVQFAGLAAIVFYMLSAVGNFPAIFNAWAMRYVPTEPNMYSKIISDAIAQGFNPNPPAEGVMMPNTLAWAAVVIGQCLPYTAAIIWIAGEVKKAESGIRQHISMEVATIVVIVVWILTLVPWLLMAGNEFTSSFFYLGGNISGLPVNSFLWTLYPAVMPQWSLVLFAFASLMSLVVTYMVGTTVVSRCLFSWSFDRLFPSILSRVDDRHKTPTTALLTAYAIALVLFGLELFVNIWTYIGVAFFLVMINVFIVSVAGLIFPLVRKDMFEQMPLKAKIGGIPVLSLISLLALVLLSWVATSYFTNAGYMGSFGITQTMIMFGVFLWSVGFIIYFVSRAYNKKRGIDLELAFKQIPPA